jgi:hypothetical protein
LNLASPAYPPADTTQAGLLNKISGLSTDFVGGDNACHDLATASQPTIWNVRMRTFNAVGNPNFEVDQRKAGTASTLPAGATGQSWMLDRWILSRVGTGTMAVAAQQVASTVTWPGTNFRITGNQLNVTLSAQQTTLAAGDYLFFSQSIEGSNLRALISDVHSLSLLVYCNQPLSFALSLRTAASPYYSLCKLCTIPTANQWTLIQLPNLPIWPSGGTWPITPGSAGYGLGICLATGSTLMPTANDTWQSGNLIGAVGMTNFASLPVNTIFVTGLVQHEPGPVCGGLIDSHFNQNLSDCQRYYQKSGSYSQAPLVSSGYAKSCGNIITSTSIYPNVTFPVEMAKPPTIRVWYPTVLNQVLIAGLGAAAVTGPPTATTKVIASAFNLSAATTAGLNTQVIYDWDADTGM